MQIKPRNEYVVVRVIPARKQNSGIIIPGQDYERSLMEVVAVGPGGLTVEGKRMPIEVEAGVSLQPGMRIFMKGGEYEQYEGEDKLQHLVIPQSAIIGIEIPGEERHVHLVS